MRLAASGGRVQSIRMHPRRIPRCLVGRATIKKFNPEKPAQLRDLDVVIVTTILYNTTVGGIYEALSNGFTFGFDFLLISVAVE